MQKRERRGAGVTRERRGSVFILTEWCRGRRTRNAGTDSWWKLRCVTCVCVFLFVGDWVGGCY